MGLVKIGAYGCGRCRRPADNEWVSVTGLDPEETIHVPVILCPDCRAQANRENDARR